MNVEDAIRDFAETDHGLPEASMRWALDNWEAAAPRFVELLSRYAEAGEASETAPSVLFFAIHLLAEKHETRAFGPLCRLLQDEETAEEILGDAITEHLSGILISTHDGNQEALRSVIEAPTADQFARAAGLEAMAFLTRTGEIADAETRAYLLRLRAEMEPQSESFIWTAWALAAANLGYRDFAEEVRELCRLDMISRFDMNFEDFEEQLQRTLDDPLGLAGFAFDHIGPFTDTLGTLSTWYGFSEQARLDAARYGHDDDDDEDDDLPDDEDEAIWPLGDPPYVNPLRHVGRNDPCPCGSGKKYKKCCLQ